MVSQLVRLGLAFFLDGLEAEHFTRKYSDVFGECLDFRPIAFGNHAVPDDLPNATGGHLLEHYRTCVLFAVRIPRQAN